MRIKSVLPFLALAALASVSNVALADSNSNNYRPADYVWTSASKNSSESMPLGGHDVGMNVWVEDGDVLIYACQSGWFDNNNTLLKAGRIRLHFADVDFSGADFRQVLCLADGSMTISSAGLKVTLWADALQPDVFIQYEGAKGGEVRLSYESWRHRDRAVPADASQQNSLRWLIDSTCVMKADVIEPDDHSVRFVHKNDAVTIFDRTVAIEKLQPIKSELYNPIANLRMQGTMLAPDFNFVGTTDGVYVDTDFRAWTFASKAKKSTITLKLRVGQATDADAFANVEPKASRKRSAQWWTNFWNRSHVILVRPELAVYRPRTEADEPKPADSAAVVVRNYELMRFMLGCNAHGLWPSKFNGSLFTFDPSFVDPNRKFTPDYRCWGGGTMTAQNQRLVYWPLIKSGDLDLLRVQLDTYNRMLQSAKARVKFYWGHGGAAFTEQIENFGLPNPAEYGEHAEGQDPGVESNAWLEHLWDTSLEFCMMALEANKYQGMDIAAYEDMIWQCLSFFDEHYQYLALKMGKEALTQDGKLVIFPGSGCETHKMAYNACSTVAALQTVGQAWIEYAKRMGKDAEMLEKAKTLVSHVPNIPTRVIEGDTCIAPAVAWARIQNVETTQMYPVFPWRVFGVGRPNLHWAIATWKKDPWAREMESARGWKQDNIWAACMGLSDDAARLEYEKMANGPYRFPAFYDMGFDWAPDFNRGGSGMIGLQEMLMQRGPEGERIELPAWPERWGKVDYLLH